MTPIHVDAPAASPSGHNSRLYSLEAERPPSGLAIMQSNTVAILPGCGTPAPPVLASPASRAALAIVSNAWPSTVTANSWRSGGGEGLPLTFADVGEQEIRRIPTSTEGSSIQSDSDFATHFSLPPAHRNPSPGWATLYARSSWPRSGRAYAARVEGARGLHSRRHRDAPQTSARDPHAELDLALAVPPRPTSLEYQLPCLFPSTAALSLSRSGPKRRPFAV
ncbi:hypothetical protein MAPG_11147 [Magnaporthiopsis poae ATCC 64411]|uniref:Uncharacterized protein n=1 Tax=Magnaporthiopsis poae (strain ATCC 64411 / 73-15) TaxID=644358 RepID=A0A0C4EEH4_MAGP6|nr:hypothetical protein MAPG_11147 [Magnaporthiopsis poae ATCC 64411]